MNPRPDLVEAFAARVDAVLVAAPFNGDKALPLDAVLVYPWHGREGTAEERGEYVLAEWEASTAAGLRGSRSANPVGWPEGLPLPLTLGDALEAVKQRKADIVADLAAEVERCARAMVDPDLVDAVLTQEGAALAEEWPWPDGGAGGRALFALCNGAGIGDREFGRMGRELTRGGGAASTFEIFGKQARNVARWAAPALNRLVRGFGDEALDMAERHGTMGGLTVLGGDGTAHRYPAAGMALLYHAERAERWRTRATFAAGEAFASVRELAGADHAGDAHFAAVDAALDGAKVGDEPDPLAAVARADQAKRSGYAGDLLAWAGKVSRELFADDPPADEAAARATVTTPAGDALRWDAAFADLLATMATQGAERAADVYQNAAKRTADVRGEGLIPGMPTPPVGTLWALWFEPNASNGARWLRVLARVLWGDVWRPRALFESAKHAPALPLLVRRNLAGMRHGAELREGSGGGFEYRALDGSLVARFGAPALNRAQLDAMRRGVSHLRGVLFEAVIRGLVRDTFKQAAEGINPYTRLVYAHGFAGFAETHGINSKYRAKLPELFEGLGAYRGADRKLPPIIAAYYTTPATRGRPAELRIDVGEVLAPGYASVVARMVGTDAGDTYLLPALPLPWLGFPGAAGADAGALCDLQWELLALFRERAEEGRDRGGWLLTERDTAAVADRAKLRGALAGAWRKPWTAGAGAWLRERPDGRLALVDDAATELLNEAANYTTTAKDRGNRTKKKKTKPA